MRDLVAQLDKRLGQANVFGNRVHAELVCLVLAAIEEARDESGNSQPAFLRAFTSPAADLENASA